MKKLFLLFTFICAISVTAQNIGSITGNVSDLALKESMPYVAVAIKEADQVITGVMTDEAGNFTVKNLPLKNIR